MSPLMLKKSLKTAKYTSLGRIAHYEKRLPVIELYTAIQAEGSRAGYPTIIIRTTGCTHRCYFGKGGWCDAWYTSIHAEKGIYSFNDIINIYQQNPHIGEMLLTGGAPTMHPKLVNELTHFAHKNDIFMSMETEGSHFLATDFPIDLLSLSPKFSNSIPVAGVKTPNGKITDDKMITHHNRLRLNYDVIRQLINYHQNYHIKPVLDTELSTLGELEVFLKALAIPDDKVWAMPAGNNRLSLIKSYAIVMNFVKKRGWRFTPRPHIIAFDTERCV